MKRLFIGLFVALLALPACAQQVIQHPWQGKRVAYLGDSITDPRNSGAKKKYWSYPLTR